MRIQSTAQYLDCLHRIAEIMDKKHPSSFEISVMELMRTAVNEFEFNEIKKYPAKEFLLDRFFNNRLNLN